MKRTDPKKQRREAKKLLLTLDRVRELQPDELSEAAGGNSCLHTNPSTGWL